MHQAEQLTKFVPANVTAHYPLDGNGINTNDTAIRNNQDDLVIILHMDLDTRDTYYVLEHR